MPYIPDSMIPPAPKRPPRPIGRFCVDCAYFVEGHEPTCSNPAYTRREPVYGKVIMKECRELRTTGIGQCEPLGKGFEEPEPDKYCFTDGSGLCIGQDPRCMHNRKVPIGSVTTRDKLVIRQPNRF
jgi:hypothetical protein